MRWSLSRLGRLTDDEWTEEGENNNCADSDNGDSLAGEREGEGVEDISFLGGIIRVGCFFLLLL